MRAFIELNVQNLLYNIEQLKKISKEKDILAVIKADAYGFGSKEIVKLLEENGVNFFGVATLDEAIQLHETGIKSNILILSNVFEEDLFEIEKKNFHVSVSHISQLKFIADNSLNIKIHLKVDTGMGRLGFATDEINFAVDFCKKNNLKLCGIFSHLSDADGYSQDSKKFTLDQINKFKKVIEGIYYDFKYIHISNTAALINYPEEIIGNLVRIGIGMYGLSGNKKIENFKNVFTLKSKILFYKTLKEDSFISYGRNYKLRANESYAILSIGYADGLRKYLSKGGYVLIDNNKLEIIGNICMDLTIVKIPTNLIKNIELGKEVIILNNDIIDSLDIEELCSWELLTGLGKRVKRIYL